ncbi:MAG: hypothetical protein VW835_14400 [Rickettsiales bacterium]
MKILKPCRDPERGRLAATRRPQQAHDLARSNIDAEIVNSNRLAERVTNISQFKGN